MPGALTHSPADILRHLLIDLGVGSLPSVSGGATWPIYAHNEPDRPDNCITVYDTQGKKSGRTHIDGEVQEHHGFSIRVRSALSDVGFTKARALAIVMDQSVYQERVIVDSSTYCVQSITRTSDVVPFGRDTPTPTKRFIHVINGIIMVRASHCS